MENLNFQVSDFIDDSNSLRYKMLENISGSELIDTLIYLRVVTMHVIRERVLNKYGVNLVWLQADPTPDKLRQLADKYKIFIYVSKNVTIYVPLGVTVDKAALAIDIAGYELVYKYISNINYKLLKTTGQLSNLKIISNRVCEIKPRILFKRLIIDCIESGGTDIHFESIYNEDKEPEHIIRYRVKRELKKSSFKLDWETTQSLMQTVIGKLSPCSAQDLDSDAGVTTSIADLFDDGYCEVRVTGCRVSAGYYIVMRIQTTHTTTFKVDELGFPKYDVEKIRELARRRTGLTLVTGEMGSGKNTTIFAMLNEIVHEPIRIIGYENPIEARMPFPQKDYMGNIEVLENLMRLAKKEDLDIAMLNEIPNSEVAFAVRDLVNSSVGVITTTHIDRVWHIPYKLQEFFGNDYKTVISQLNAVINQKMFTRWECSNFQKRILNPDAGTFERFCYAHGVTQYFQPEDATTVKYFVQPLAEIVVFTDEMKTAMENFNEIWRAEQMIRSHCDNNKWRLEHKLAEYINNGICSLEEMRRLL